MIQPSTPGPQADEIVRRLRAWTVSGWAHDDRATRTRRALQELADLAAARRGVPAPVVPAVGPQALGAQLAVLLADARRAGVDDAGIARVVLDLGADLRIRPSTGQDVAPGGRTGVDG